MQNTITPVNEEELEAMRQVTSIADADRERTRMNAVQQAIDIYARAPQGSYAPEDVLKFAEKVHKFITKA